MTTIEKLKVMLEAPTSTSIIAYRTWIKEILKEQEKYSWHDLRKNPEDLPTKIATDYLTISVNGTYIVRTYEGIAIKGFLDSYGHDLKTHQREAMQVIAWREIEPFEEEE